ncbi:molybdopterin converting factor subunit 1 [Endozoicomonas sp. SM1973]|uniref:Molybdopterin converting factor subunit 1 n=1 Tax=Spartinivicinus marinus TaxID=2994442 RepID=A0A853IEH7_9GAMM|nr:molybdopterin converting factor subunit 1 [Spartinivicinus marinus]MCX4025365.1 molybdopterin converting factor subunit 1 [Spartinivicinus marinus]NYZ68938.1 molybdopterin converting factor subunit 1 [Spartinivicinus marinus]
MIKVLFFGRLREQLAVDSIDLNDNVESLSVIIEQLKQRGDNWQQTLSNPNLKAAINQTMVPFNSSVKDGDEVALFPPVTGG